MTWPVLPRRKVEIPDILYHITPSQYVDDILRDGLIPCKKQTLRYDYEIDEDGDRIGVYLSSCWEVIYGVDTFDYNPEGFTVLAVSVHGLKDKLIHDIAYNMDGLMEQSDIDEGLYDEFAWYINQVIPPARITVHKHIGNQHVKRIVV